MNQVYSKKPPSPYAALQKSRWKTYGKVTHQLHQLSLIPSIWNRLHERKKKKNRDIRDQAHGASFTTHFYVAICLY